MVRFVRKPSFQIIRTEYTTSAVSANSSDGEAQRTLEIYVHTQNNISQEEIKEHTDLIYEQWQTGIFSDTEIDAIHILYYDSIEKLKIPDGYFHEVYGVSDSVVYSNSRNTVAVERKVVFYGRVTPDTTINWSEKIGNKTYSGTLNLYSYNYSVADQITTAYYRRNLSSE